MNVDENFLYIYEKTFEAQVGNAKDLLLEFEQSKRISGVCFAYILIEKSLTLVLHTACLSLKITIFYGFVVMLWCDLFSVVENFL